MADDTIHPESRALPLEAGAAIDELLTAVRSLAGGRVAISLEAGLGIIRANWPAGDCLVFRRKELWRCIATVERIEALSDSDPLLRVVSGNRGTLAIVMETAQTFHVLRIVDGCCTSLTTDALAFAAEPSPLLSAPSGGRRGHWRGEQLHRADDRPASRDTQHLRCLT